MKITLVRHGQTEANYNHIIQGRVVNKELNEMTDYECILLAGIPNAPSVYAPTKNPDLAKQRQRQVMEKMIENEYLTEDEANEILRQAE